MVRRLIAESGSVKEWAKLSAGRTKRVRRQPPGQINASILEVIGKTRSKSIGGTHAMRWLGVADGERLHGRIGNEDNAFGAIANKETENKAER